MCIHNLEFQRSIKYKIKRYLSLFEDVLNIFELYITF